MIRVHPAREPADFDAKVRQPGLRAVAELVGEASGKRRGPRRKAVAATRDAIKPDDFPPYWRLAIDDLCVAYQRICAYTCRYIHPITGASTVDHFVPKSGCWDRVYEWTNYRLACAEVNSRMRDAQKALDPFELEDGWFALELVGYQVIVGPNVGHELSELVRESIRLLDLNGQVHRMVREAYAEDYFRGDISIDYLRRRAPLVARELTRQGKLPHLAGDSPSATE